MNVITDEPVTGVADRVAAVAGLGDDAADGLLKSLTANWGCPSRPSAACPTSPGG